MDTMNWTLLVTVAAAVGSGLMAGLFFAFSTSVIPGLKRRPNAEGIQAMQAANVAIINPVFLTVFLGTTLASAALLVTALFADQPGSAWRLVGAVLYLAGSFGLTMAYNVPLNSALAAADPHSPEGAAVWTTYVSRWTAANHVRALACAGSVVALVLAARR